MDGLGGYRALWNELETNIKWNHLYKESNKYNKVVNITEKKQAHLYREETNGCQWGCSGA